MKGYKNSSKSKSGAGMKGRDMFNENRKGSKAKATGGYGGLKNDTYIRPQPK
jgi:hypothetical protein